VERGKYGEGWYIGVQPLTNYPTLVVEKGTVLMLKMHNEEFEKDSKVFEDRLYLHFKKFFDLNVSFFRQLSDVIDEKMNAIGPKSDFEWAITFLFYRSYKLYWTILILCEKGFASEAGILLRSLMEQAINMEWIAKEDSDERSKLFLEYFHVARKKLYDKYEKHGVFHQLTDAQKQWMKSRDEIEARYNQVKNNYPEERFWAPKSIGCRAHTTGAGYDFDFYYWYLSFLTHSNVACQFEYLRPQEPTDAFIVGPNYSSVDVVLHLSYKYLLVASNRWNVVFKLGLDKLLLDLLSKLEDISVIRQEPESNSQE